jgi:hypothetical protein
MRDDTINGSCCLLASGVTSCSSLLDTLTHTSSSSSSSLSLSRVATTPPISVVIGSSLDPDQNKTFVLEQPGQLVTVRGLGDLVDGYLTRIDSTLQSGDVVRYISLRGSKGSYNLVKTVAIVGYAVSFDPNTDCARPRDDMTGDLCPVLLCARGATGKKEAFAAIYNPEDMSVVAFDVLLKDAFYPRVFYEFQRVAIQRELGFPHQFDNHALQHSCRLRLLAAGQPQ